MTSSRMRRRWRLEDVLVVAGPAVLAAALCLYELTTRSLWLDEAATVAIATQHGAAFGTALAHDGGNMLGYYALLHVLIGAFGSGVFVLRFPSALAAGATVAATGMIALRLWDRRAALAASLLAALSLPLVYWGQDARGYSLMVALICLSFLAFAALLDERTGRGAWIAYVALTTAAVYAGLEAVLVVPAQLLALLLWHRGRLRAVLSAVAVVAICCVPLALLATDRGSGQLFWVPRPTLEIGKQIAQALTSSGLQPIFYSSTGTALLILTALVLTTSAWQTWRLHRTAPALAAGPALVLSWLLIPVLLALIESAVGQSIFQARYLLGSLPAVALALAFVIADHRLPRAAAPALLVALLALRALQLAPAYGVSPENWRAATASVSAQARSGDCAAFYPLDTRMPFEYYLGTRARVLQPILPSLQWGRVRPYVEQYISLSRGQVAELPARCRRVWLVSSHEGRVGGPPTSRANYARFHELTGGLRAAYAHAHSTSFGYPGAVVVQLFSR